MNRKLERKKYWDPDVAIKNSPASLKKNDPNIRTDTQLSSTDV